MPRLSRKLPWELRELQNGRKPFRFRIVGLNLVTGEREYSNWHDIGEEEIYLDSVDALNRESKDRVAGGIKYSMEYR